MIRRFDVCDEDGEVYARESGNGSWCLFSDLKEERKTLGKQLDNGLITEMSLKAALLEAKGMLDEKDRELGKARRRISILEAARMGESMEYRKVAGDLASARGEISRLKTEVVEAKKALTKELRGMRVLDEMYGASLAMTQAKLDAARKRAQSAFFINLNYAETIASQAVEIEHLRKKLAAESLLKS